MVMSLEGYCEERMVQSAEAAGECVHELPLLCSVSSIARVLTPWRSLDIVQ